MPGPPLVKITLPPKSGNVGGEGGGWQGGRLTSSNMQPRQEGVATVTFLLVDCILT